MADQADASAPALSEKFNLPEKRLPDYWDRIMGDERLGRARSKLSMHELRLLLIHALDRWHGIDWLKGDEGLVIAYCPPSANFPKGRKMIWDASVLAIARASDTPRHLQFPATHWMLAPGDPIRVPETNAIFYDEAGPNGERISGPSGTGDCLKQPTLNESKTNV